MYKKIEVIVNNVHYGRHPDRKIANRGDHVLVSEIGADAAAKWIKSKLAKEVSSPTPSGDKPTKDDLKKGDKPLKDELKKGDGSITTTSSQTKPDSSSDDIEKANGF